MEIGTQEGNTEIFIRGVGSTNNTELGGPSAATYVNGIYIPRPRGLGAQFFDITDVSAVHCMNDVSFTDLIADVHSRQRRPGALRGAVPQDHDGSRGDIKRIS